MNQRVNRPETADGYTYEFTPAANKPEDLTALLTSATAKTSSPEAVKA